MWRGIPYAQPPLGDLRWRPPTFHQGWARTLDASNFGPACIQYPCWSSENVSRISEDCLTVNVVSPPRLNVKHPTVIYINAGEFHCGTSDDSESRLTQFAKDVVYVSFNYRVGAFGFLASQDLRGRDASGSTGNYGMLDQRFLLQWVHHNIEAFGGDASRVTIWGESSGGTSVAYHLVRNTRRTGASMFQRAILQSPGLTQVKRFQDAETNYAWLLALLTAYESGGCQRGPGYVSFEADSLRLARMGSVIHISEVGLPLKDAEKWCNIQPICAGFVRHDPDMSSRTFFVRREGLVEVIDEEDKPVRARSVTYVKEGSKDVKVRVECLLQANAELINNVTGYVPRDDTFHTDGWAPVLDGVELLEPLTESVRRGRIDSAVRLLLGTNLDEGTQFMFLTPSLRCTADGRELERWSQGFYGKDVGFKIPELYSPTKLRRPLPACGMGGSPFDVPGERAAHRNAAMRSAGDAAIRCPSLELANTVVATNGTAFVYEFTLTPSRSVNFRNTTVLGAFHGAEVPFVFGDKFELDEGWEQQLSAAMGCYWRNFISDGDPNSSPCTGAQVPWPRYNKTGSFLELGANIEMHAEEHIAKTRCSLFKQFGHTDLRTLLV